MAATLSGRLKITRAFSEGKGNLYEDREEMLERSMEV